MSERVEIYEVGPRDGLQNEPREIPVVDKVALIDCLSKAGFARIEVASFVSPKWVPQMAGSAEVMARIRRVPGVAYTALCPNLRGLDAAHAAGADEVAIFGSASEGFSRANINASIEESLARFAPIAKAARALELPLRGYVSCVVECPYDGKIDPGAVARVTGKLAAMGCHEISLGETLGRARPEDIDTLLSTVTQEVPPATLAGHYHDTAGRALEAVEVSLDHGLRVFDAAVGGLGGCPYAPGAAGNVATEAIHDRLLALGYETGLDRDVLDRAAEMARAMRGKSDRQDNV
ncbi:MAG: hydroxymethylglutaryl-CoA lyase [Pseudomonadota bacterium]